MDENLVAVHMIESSEGTYVTAQVMPEDDTYEDNGDDNEMINATEDADELEGNEELDEEEEPQDDQELEEADGNEDMIDNSEADDIIIAEAVVVTQYSCKFCNRRFDTIDKVKNHYLLRHNTDQSIVKRFSGGGQQKTDDND
ncbi:unnamed protein product, partial [Medioppia subpectinata]